jgi:hypothetical protein
VEHKSASTEEVAIIAAIVTPALQHGQRRTRLGETTAMTAARPGCAGCSHIAHR